jgi:hypothetical protein
LPAQLQICDNEYALALPVCCRELARLVNHLRRRHNAKSEKHALRSLLTIASSVIGVSVFFAMHAANQSVFNAFQDTVRRIAGVWDGYACN